MVHFLDFLICETGNIQFKSAECQPQFVHNIRQFFRVFDFPRKILAELGQCDFMRNVVVVAGEVRESDVTFIGALPLIVFSQLDFKAMPMKRNTFSNL